MWLAVDLVLDHFNLRPEEIVRVIVELKVPKGFFLGLHYPILGSNMLCGERGKTRPHATKSREHVENCFFNYYFCTNCSKGEKYEKIKHVISLEFPFLDIYQKSRHPLFGSWSLLFVHVWFPNSEDPICFRKCNSFIYDHGSVIMKCDREETI